MFNRLTEILYKLSWKLKKLKLEKASFWTGSRVWGQNGQTQQNRQKQIHIKQQHKTVSEIKIQLKY